MNAPADTIEGVNALLVQLSNVAGSEWLPRQVRCTRCSAEPGDPCRRPDGEPYMRRTGKGAEPAFHAPRERRAAAIANRCPTWLFHELAMCRQGSTDPDCQPAAMARRLRASALYRLSVERGAIVPRRHPQLRIVHGGRR